MKSYEKGGLYLLWMVLTFVKSFDRRIYHLLTMQFVASTEIFLFTVIL